MLISSALSFPALKTQPLPRNTISCSSACKAPTMHNPTTSLYDTLRVSHNATLKDIKTAYRALAKTYHPDVIGHAAAQGSNYEGREFVEICDAYATLSDPMARAVYDMSLGFRNRRTSGVLRRSPSSSGGLFYQTSRRWETDQCW